MPSSRPVPCERHRDFVFHVIKDLEDGIHYHAHGDSEVGNVDFDCYHLRKSLYEAAVREAGIKGELNWGVTSVPERYLRGESPGWASIAELESYQKVYEYGFLVVAK